MDLPGAVGQFVEAGETLDYGAGLGIETNGDLSGIRGTLGRGAARKQHCS
jgi:hypothetical protein